MYKPYGIVYQLSLHSVIYTFIMYCLCVLIELIQYTEIIFERSIILKSYGLGHADYMLFSEGIKYVIILNIIYLLNTYNY